jgi:hypothetical protein
MNREQRRRTATNLSQMGILSMGLAWPLGVNSHPAVQAAITVLGAVIVFSGILKLSRLVTEQEKQIEALQTRLNTTESGEPQ